MQKITNKYNMYIIYKGKCIFTILIILRFFDKFDFSDILITKLKCHLNNIQLPKSILMFDVCAKDIFKSKINYPCASGLAFVNEQLLANLFVMCHM